MSDFKYTLEKHKQKILIGISALAVVGAGFGVYCLLNKPESDIKEEVFEDTVSRKADYIMMANSKGQIDLYGTDEDSIVNSLDLQLDNAIYSRGIDLETIMVFDNNIFYEISENGGLLDVKEVNTFNGSINSFKYSTKYIVTISDNEINAINRETNKTSQLSIDSVEEYVIADNCLVYSNGNYLYSLNLDVPNSTPVKIEIGDKTEGLFVMNGKVISYNNFGSGNGITTLLKLNPSDLYIDYASKQDNSELYPVTPDSDDDSIKFIENTVNKGNSFASHYTVILDDNVKSSKTKVVLNDTISNEKLGYNKDNTVSTKGYMYTLEDENITIYDLRAESIDSTIPSDKTFFMPILK